MFKTLAKSVFGSSNDRYVKSIGKIVDQVNALEDQIKALSDAELKAQTDKLRAQLAEGKTLADITPEAFATVREASIRVLGMRHFDVQLIGGVVLHRGEIAEMRTGEGKTLVATLATYLNAIEGKGVHIVTVNEYLARRDAEWMGQIHRFLGLSVGVIVPGLSEDQRRAAYFSDITYGTNSELGFDYLRDNMKHDAPDHLHIEMPHAERAFRCFTHRGEGFGQNIVQRLALGQLAAELVGLPRKLGIGQRFHLGFESVYLVDGGAVAFEYAVVLRAENLAGELREHLMLYPQAVFSVP